MQRNASPLDHALVRQAYAWAQAAVPAPPPEEHYCPTRDVLQAQMERCRREATTAGVNESASYLLHAILSEIGGNSFDHNLGAWKDIPGAMFAWAIRENGMTSVLVDRGQGVRATLRRVVPTISSDVDALRTAFLERVSGRAPEQRGNGLKFVRKTLLEDGIDLVFHSDKASYRVIGKQEEWKEEKEAVAGCLAVISSPLA